MTEEEKQLADAAKVSEVVIQAMVYLTQGEKIDTEIVFKIFLLETLGQVAATSGPDVAVQACRAMAEFFESQEAADMLGLGAVIPKGRA